MHVKEVLKGLKLNIDITEAGKKNKKSAIRLLEILVHHVAKPGVGCTNDGRVTLYWDDKVNYADLEVHKDGKTYSLFVKSRETTNESFVESFTLRDITAKWLITHMSPFLLKKPESQA